MTSHATCLWASASGERLYPAFVLVVPVLPARPLACDCLHGQRRQLAHICLVHSLHAIIRVGWVNLRSLPMADVFGVDRNCRQSCLAGYLLMIRTLVQVRKPGKARTSSAVSGMMLSTRLEADDAGFGADEQAAATMAIPRGKPPVQPRRSCSRSPSAASCSLSWQRLGLMRHTRGGEVPSANQCR